MHENALSSGKRSVGYVQELAQLLFLWLVWAFVVIVQCKNDGLGFQPDSSTHALNGIFWGDFVRAQTFQVLDYSNRYFARYPGINPVSYPPLFYWIEASLFGLFGPSPFIAKSAVLFSALFGVFYMWKWLRRWVGPEAGYFAAVVLLLPIMVNFAHGIMLNVPSAAFLVAGLYHGLLWLDRPNSRQIYPAMFFNLAAILTYFPSVVLVPILIVWLFYLGKWQILFRPRTMVLMLIFCLLLAPPFVLALRWASANVQMATFSMGHLATRRAWFFYLEMAPGAFSWPVLVLAGAGVILGIATPVRRQITILFLVWVLVTYVFLSYLKAKEARYILPMGYPLVGFASIAISIIGSFWSRHWIGSAQKAFVGLPLALVFFMVYQVSQLPSSAIIGMKDVAVFLGGVAPSEFVFYDGPHQALFTFFVREGDPGRKRGVVRGDKLLYVIPTSGAMKPKEFVSSANDVLDTLIHKSGCQWVVLENDTRLKFRKPSQLLRKAVQKPPFEFVRSFPLSGPNWLRSIDVYRITVPIDHPETLDIPVPTAGENARLQTAPL